MEQQLINKQIVRECWEDRDIITIECNHCGTRFGVKNYCRKLTCEDCQKKYAYDVFKKVRSSFVDMDNLKFMTLTFVNTKTFSKDMMRKYKLMFRNFNTRFLRKEDIIDKGFYVFEVKHTVNGWNTHIHLLYEGLSIDKYALGFHWKKFTKNSDICDVKKVYGGQKAIKYVCKYLGKVPQMSDNHQKTYLNVLKGFKRYNLISASYGKKEKGSCPVCDSPSDFNLIFDQSSFNVYMDDSLGIKFLKNRRKPNPDILELDLKYSWDDLEDKGFDVEKLLREGNIMRLKGEVFVRV